MRWFFAYAYHFIICYQYVKICMQCIPINTRVLRPPKDHLWDALQAALPPLIDGDVLVVSSKVVAISEGRCVPMVGTDKETLVRAEAELIIPRSYWNRPLTIARHAFVSGAGIDESNGNGYYILLPEDVFRSAHELWQQLCMYTGCSELGVIIADSASAPFRYGAQGVALSWWGIEPLRDHRGRKDLFGREIVVERSNIVDGLAAAATLVGGEVDECTPVVLVRGVPQLTYTDADTRAHLLPEFGDDIFRVLYEQYLPKDDTQ